MYTLFYGSRRAHFLAMPRTASKACRDAFRAIGAETRGGHHNISEFDSVVQEGDLVMSTVRNHFDWFVSFWYLNNCPGKFDRFVPKLCRESEWISRNPDCTRCELFWKYAPVSTVILRYERVEQDFTEAMAKHGFPKPILKRTEIPKPRHYRTYYKPGTIQLIQRKFKEELLEYGYAF